MVTSSVKNEVLLLAVAGLMSCSFSGVQFFREAGEDTDITAIAPPIAAATVSVDALLQRQQTGSPLETTVQKQTGLAAQVNGEPIPLVSYDRQVNSLKLALQAQGLDPDSAVGQARLSQLKQQLLDGLIEQKIIEQQAKLLGVEATEAEVEAQAEVVQAQLPDEQFEAWLTENGLTNDSFLTDLQAELSAAKLFDQVTKEAPTHAEQVLLRVIRVKDQAVAQQVVEQLKLGASFEDQAQAYSQDEATRANGGLLGWLPAGLNIVPSEVKQVAFSMQPGDMSGPVATGSGFFIMKVDDRAANRELTETQRQQFKKQIFTDWLKQQWDTATIERFVNM